MNEDRKNEQERSTKTVNIFLLVLAKELIKARTLFYYDNIRTETICWYVFQISTSEIIDTIKYPAPRGDYPEGYKGFGRHLWETMDKLVYSKNNLNKLAKGAGYKDWLNFDEEFKFFDGRIWAEKLKGRLYEDITQGQVRKLNYYVDQTVEAVFAKTTFFKNRSKQHRYPHVLFHNNHFCLRLVSNPNEDLKKLDELQFSNNGESLDYNYRLKISKQSYWSFFIMEDLMLQPIGSICVQAFKIDDRRNLDFNFKLALDGPDLKDALDFYIRELRFNNSESKDFLLNNLLRILAGIKGHVDIDGILKSPKGINFYMHSDDDLGYDLIGDYGFRVYQQYDTGPWLYRATILDVIKYSLIKQMDKS